MAGVFYLVQYCSGSTSRISHNESPEESADRQKEGRTSLQLCILNNHLALLGAFGCKIWEALCDPQSTAGRCPQSDSSRISSGPIYFAVIVFVFCERAQRTEANL